MPSYREWTQQVGDRWVAALQHAGDAITTVHGMARAGLPPVQVPEQVARLVESVTGHLPGPAEVVEAHFALTDRILRAQRELTLTLLGAGTTPAESDVAPAAPDSAETEPGDATAEPDTAEVRPDVAPAAPDSAQAEPAEADSTPAEPDTTEPDTAEVRPDVPDSAQAEPAEADSTPAEPDTAEVRPEDAPAAPDSAQAEPAELDDATAEPDAPRAVAVPGGTVPPVREVLDAGRDENAQARLVLDCLGASDRPLAKARILAESGLPPQAWATVIEELLAQGAICRQGRRAGTRYRLTTSPGQPPAQDETTRPDA